MDFPQAIFFDMDGTILDWETGMEDRWRAACENGCADHGLDAEKLLAAVHDKRRWFWEDAERARTGRMDLNEASRMIVREAMRSLGLDLDPVAHAIADDYRASRLEVMTPYPGAIETLDYFRARGVPMALITNGAATSQRESIERFGLAPYFHCIVIEGEFGCGKPDERVFRHALASCGVDPAQTWMVGDNLEADIAPAIALGMHAVWVDAAGGGLSDGTTAPHRTVRAISELVASRDREGLD